MSTESNDVERFRQLLDAAERVVFFTGAGISTESGIPDFRGPQGVWKTQTPIQFQDFVASEEIRQKSWAGRFEGDRVIERASPNKGHEAVARLIETGKVTAIITQNIDNLHQESGVPDDRVIELHGNSTHAKCLTCETRYEMAAVEDEWRRTGQVGPCSSCGGIVKSATISFGQAMPVRAMELAETATLDCDLFIVAGSSLVVYPAASFPEVAKRNGARLVILNNEETPLDPIADLVVHRQIGPTLSYLAGIN